MVKHRASWGRTPAKGTVLRRMLKMLLRPEGATSFEMVEAGATGGMISHTLVVLRDEKGWDIRSFPCSSERQQSLTGTRRTKPPVVYKVVGRMRWNGGYRSLVDPKDYTPVRPSDLAVDELQVTD